MQAVRLADRDGRTIVVANLHCTSYAADERLAEAELLRAAWFAVSEAQPEDVVVLAGDFNVTRGPVERRCAIWRARTGGSRSPGPASTTSSFAARPPRRCAAGPTSGGRTAAASCRIMRRWSSRSRDAGRRSGRGFPVLDRHAYLNAGTFGPLARTTLAAMAELRAWEGEHGRGGRAYFDAMLERRERVRELLAAQIRVPPEHVALTDSTTQGRAHRRQRSRAR